ncbi:MAG TPA: hypothetical protein VG406_05530 [Isosphaeraceae bacterium]|nr:hypothetical protein [Isosphaeraceae bacterium]
MLFDPTVEPDFRGPLGVVLTGHAVDDRVVFRGTIELEVVGRPREWPRGDDDLRPIALD